jgi:membrane-bound lytic murein transglycosylase D
VAFWTQVFTHWDRDQVVFFDARDLSQIYEVRRLPPSNGTRERERERERLRRRWKESLREELETLARPGTDYGSLTGRQERLFVIWDEQPDPAVYRQAAEELRAQRGIREQFREGVARSARYYEDFRQVFREEGVPEELVFLPHVESSYRWDARSKVGATGMWQFMATTARSYMVVSAAVDERLDPHAAARGAARYLQAAYDSLGAWPLAITSYNHGVSGMKNAIRATGTDDIAVIIATYNGPLFKFAGRNFYPEFLAAMDCASTLLANPDGLALDDPIAFDTFTLPAYVKLNHVAEALNVSPEELRTLNPALRRSAVRGELHLTKGYRLKLPPGSGVTAPQLFTTLPAARRPITEPQRTYRVRNGDNLGAIARKFRTSVGTLQRLNGIKNPNHLRAGTLLKLPH